MFCEKSTNKDINEGITKMIKQIYIRNFRSIKAKKFKNIGNTLIFIGENNSGKSTVLNALRVFFDKDDKVNKITKNDIRHSCKFFEIILSKNLDEKFYNELEIIMRSEGDKLYEVFIKEFMQGRDDRKLFTKVYYSSFKSFINQKYFKGMNLQLIGLKLRVESKGLIRKYSITNSRYKDLGEKNLKKDDSFIDVFFSNIASIDDERKFFEEVDGNAKSISNSVFNLFVTGLAKSENLHESDNIENKTVNDLSITELNQILNNRLKTESELFFK